MKLVRITLIWVHRYLGIALSSLFVIWFLSGIGMMFSGGMPRLDPQERLFRQSAIDLSQIKLSPAEASGSARRPGGGGFGRGGPGAGRRGTGGAQPPRQDQQAAANTGQAQVPDEGQGQGQGGGPGRGGGVVSIRSFLGRPVYRVSGRTVFADDGSVLGSIDETMAKHIAADFMKVPEEKLHYSLLKEIDQWTLGQRNQLPLHRLDVDDGNGTVLYISPKNGDVVLKTTRGTRALAWVAAIPHWFYIKALRINQPLWFQLVCWTSALGGIVALAGIALSFTQLKFRRPFAWSKISSYIPYSGLMRWHYITGTVFGVLTFTWVFSGLLSMEPFGWASGRTLQGNLRGALTGGPLNSDEFPAIDPATWKGLMPNQDIKEIDYTRIQGDPYFVVRTAPADLSTTGKDRPHQPYYSQSGVDPSRVLLNAKTMQARTEPFSAESLMAKVKETWPDTPIVESTLLTSYDSYYYSRDGQRPLPVLRVKFDDPVKTWIYIDANMSQQVAAVHKLDRVERWIYNGLHSLDFSFWYDNKPVWYTGLIILSLGGATVSILGMYVGFKRLGRGAKRLVSPPVKVTAQSGSR